MCVRKVFCCVEECEMHAPPWGNLQGVAASAGLHVGWPETVAKD